MCELVGSAGCATCRSSLSSNKLDCEGRDPFDLLDEIEQSLALDVTPASGPIGMGRDFLGTYDLFADAFLLFERGAADAQPADPRPISPEEPRVAGSVSMCTPWCFPLLRCGRGTEWLGRLDSLSNKYRLQLRSTLQETTERCVQIRRGNLARLEL
jgi:hypothetical protein